MICIIILQFLLYFWATSLWASTCTDIASVDIAKQSLVAASYYGEPFYGIYNGPAPGGKLGTDPDLKLAVEQNHLLRPEGSSGIRVVEISEDQRKGSSTYYYVFVFECRKGTLQKIFEATGQGVQLRRATARDLELSVGIWRPNDPHSSPSREVRILYQWRPDRQRFVRRGSKAACPWLP
ncbi:MAG: hypothetical protein JST93_11235 [Acidobacteria bacterium]|nr:hypothetical protein [Acidobacteriota bacterium]